MKKSKTVSKYHVLSISASKQESGTTKYYCSIAKKGKTICKWLEEENIQNFQVLLDNFQGEKEKVVKKNEIEISRENLKALIEFEGIDFSSEKLKICEFDKKTFAISKEDTGIKVYTRDEIRQKDPISYMRALEAAIRITNKN